MKQPRITFKLHERETGLRSVGAGPRGWAIRVNGEEIGSVSASGGHLGRPILGWYFYARDDAMGIPLENTASKLVRTPEEAKAKALEYVRACLANAPSRAPQEPEGK